MTAVGLGQHGSEAVGPGFESFRAKYFYDLNRDTLSLHPSYL